MTKKNIFNLRKIIEDSYIAFLADSGLYNALIAKYALNFVFMILAFFYLFLIMRPSKRLVCLYTFNYKKLCFIELFLHISDLFLDIFSTVLFLSSKIEMSFYYFIIAFLFNIMLFLFKIIEYIALSHFQRNESLPTTSFPFKVIFFIAVIFTYSSIIFYGACFFIDNFLLKIFISLGLRLIFLVLSFFLVPNFFKALNTILFDLNKTFNVEIV